MSAQTTFTPPRHVVPRIAEADSSFIRNHAGLLASLGFAALLLASAPVLAQVLGTASDFAVLGATPSVTNTGPTIVSGNIGVYPAASITGFPPGSIVPGTGFLHFADSVAQQAQADNLTAFGALTAGTGAAINPALGGQTLTPGTYNAGQADLTGILTFNGPGLYIIRTTALTTAAGLGASAVRLINGASPCDIFWTSASSVSIGTGSVMAGSILAHTSITIGTGAILEGRALAYTGTVTMDSDRITACSGGTAPGFNVPPVRAIPPTAGSIPTLSEWAMILLASLMAITGFAAMRRRQIR